ncbi:cytochrome P450 89A2-like [Mercurialis annua]|uniref:cytochrome P450 89A2-like n=1 Tax=Mercurialis annua TaxID=3986 RepID=UPI0024ADB5DF|nr:cytochrome P450 89A2-like [Mercurialis annua]
METWLIIFISLTLSIIINHFSSAKTSAANLPPGPSPIPIFGSSLWLTTSLFDLESALRSLHSKYGPILTLHTGTRPTIFIADHTLAHQALIQQSSLFADRPPAMGMEIINTSNQLTISSAFYGPTWRILRRNLTAKILNPSNIKSYSHIRKLVLQTLKDRIESEFKDRGAVQVIGHFKYAMFSLIAFMCFGDNLEEDQIKKIEEVQRPLLSNFVEKRLFSFLPSLSKFLFRKQWEEPMRIRKNQENVLIPLIRSRKEKKLSENQETEGKALLSYIDTLMDLELPDDKRKLEEQEIVSLLSEVFNGGTESTAAALQWILANLVKHPQIQEKLYMEAKEVVKETIIIKEDDLQEMPYLKAVVLEGLRRHPPAHMLVPHAVSEDTMLENYVIPKNGSVNFMVAEMGWDSKVWADPAAFKPERFMTGEVFDMSGSREIKMMPFGVGRRMCPGYGLAMLHLEYFVANLVWSYEWRAVNEDDIDLSEKLEFSVVMKFPLQAQIIPRRS